MTRFFALSLLMACGPSGPPVTIALTWDTDADVDLYLLRTLSTDPRGDSEEEIVGTCHKVGHWGPDPASWPEFHRDAREGFGPERITIEAPRRGTYPIAVHRFRQIGADPVATVVVSSGGQEIFSDERSLGESTYWTAALLHVPEMEVEPIDEVRPLPSPCNR